ncbi:MAG: hypothetical protein NTZ68_02080 [Candidatus Dependentiae bacterium]|nr:hypothetical protein [Candidatus Dependentiae bacterium]
MSVHKQMAAGRWFEMTLMEQLANVGCDVSLTISWKKKEDLELSQQALARALELLDLTIADPKYKNTGTLKELVTIREALVDYFTGANEYGSSDSLWENYFYRFNYAAALQQGK